MPSLAQYDAFVAVAELRSLARAARQLGLSPSAISKQLSALERELKATLIERSHRSLQLTEVGQALHTRARSFLADIQAAESEVVRTRDALSGQIRLTVATPLARSVLIPALSQFAARYPDTRFDIAVTDRVEDLVAQRRDFGFRLGQLADTRLLAMPLLVAHPVFCAAPAYLANHGKPLRFSELRNHRLAVLTTLNLSAAVNRLFARKRRVAINLDGLHTCDDVNTLHAMVNSGLCIGALLDCTIQRELASGNLVRLFPEHTFPGKRLYLVYKRGTRAKRLLVFKEFMRSALRQK